MVYYTHNKSYNLKMLETFIQEKLATAGFFAFLNFDINLMIERLTFNHVGLFVLKNCKNEVIIIESIRIKK